MAKIEDVLKIERERSQSTTWNEIHLFKVGEFYRAYEFSAWLTAVVSFNDHVRQQTKDRAPQADKFMGCASLQRVNLQQHNARRVDEL